MNNEIKDIQQLKQFINLYKQCKPVSSLSKVNNKESRAFSLKIKGDAIRFGKTSKLLNYIPQREGLYEFFADNKYFWIIPLETEPHKVYGYVLRGYSHKEYNVFRLTNVPSVIFGLYDFEDYKFNSNTPIIVTEGVKDALALKTVYPYTLALNTAGFTTSSFEFITALTNKLILVYDNDRAGIEALTKDKAKAKENSIKTYSIKLRYKDAGEYIEHPKDLKILNSIIQQYI